MLDTEFGGMNEIFADLYADTGDRRWLDLSYKFEHKSFIEPLKRRQDNLARKHGNTQVPKLIGSLARYAYSGDPEDLAAAQFFWDCVANHHSFATGGHGKDEYFGEPNELSDRIDGRTAETCNVYNMLKLTRMLFALEPRAEYAEFHERALFNHILGSIDPEDGSTCYMVPVGMGVQREYQGMFRSFTCCVGSGMESHALHGLGIYYEDGEQLWINLYAPSAAEWKAAGVELEMETDFPVGESATVTLTLDEPQEFTLALRRPTWAGEGFHVTVNDEPLASLPAAGHYVKIERTWNTGDRVEVRLPKKLHLEPLPDNEQRVAVMWGPLVLAGDLGPERERGRRRRDRESVNVPVLVAAEKPVDEWVQPDEDTPGNFRTEGVGRPNDIELAPFYLLQRRLYAAYWDLFTPSKWAEREEEIAAERERLRKLEEATVAFAQPGQMQPERDYNFQGEETWTISEADRDGRIGRDWFSFELPVDAAAPMVLAVTYRSGERPRDPKFDILIDGERIADDVTLKRDRPPRFYDVRYPIPASLLEGKEKINVRFETTEGSAIGPVFGLRMMRAAAEP
jgi:DUF1680 family protein